MSDQETEAEKYHSLRSERGEYIEGFNAYGTTYNNPYPVGTDQHDAWEFGWNDAWYDHGNKN